MQKLFYLVLILLKSSDNFAAQENITEINEWADGNTPFSQVNYKSSDGSIKSFQAVISNIQDGKAGVELRFYDSDIEGCALEPVNGLAVIRISGQEVTMKAQCFGSGGIRYHATTEEGRAYVVNSFLSNEYVPAILQGYDVKFPTIGFRAAWDIVIKATPQQF